MFEFVATVFLSLSAVVSIMIIAAVYKDSGISSKLKAKFRITKTTVSRLEASKELKAIASMAYASLVYSALAVGGYCIVMIYTAPTIFGYLLVSPSMISLLQLAVYLIVGLYILSSLYKRLKGHLAAERKAQMILRQYRK